MTEVAENRSTSAKTDSKKPTWLKLLAVVALVIGVLAGIYWAYAYITHGRFQQETNNAYIQADSVPIAPKVTGYVREVFVDENQLVKAGQSLVRIDATDYQATVDGLRSEVAAAEARVVAARAAIGEQRGQVEQARAQVDAAQVAVAYAKGSAARYASLSEIGAETRERYDNARYDVDRAKAERVVRQKALSSAAKRYPALKGQLAVANAQLNAVKTQLSQAIKTQEDTVIKAVLGGIIGSKTVRTGQFVQPGQRLMTIVPSTDLYIIANFKETQLALMREGQSVDIRVDAFDGVSIKGEVESLAPATGAEFSLVKPENATGNFTKIVQRVPIRIKIFAGPTARKLLRAGLSVTVSVNTKDAHDELDQLEEESRKLATKRGQ